MDIRPPKYGSERVIPIPDHLVELLATHIALGHRGEWLCQGAGRLNRTEHSRVLVAQDPRRRGLSGVRLPDLRHFSASGLIAAGCDVVTVQRALGHSEATTTLNTSSHLWPSAEDRTRGAATARKFAALVRAGCGQEVAPEPVNWGFTR